MADPTPRLGLARPDDGSGEWGAGYRDAMTVIDSAVAELQDAPVPEVGYLHLQPIPDAVWVITHELGFNPSVTVVDSSGREVEGEVQYLSPTSIQVTFSGAFSGSAFLS